LSEVTELSIKNKNPRLINEGRELNKIVIETQFETFIMKEHSIAPKLSLEAISTFSCNLQIKGIASISNSR